MGNKVIPMDQELEISNRLGYYGKVGAIDLQTERFPGIVQSGYLVGSIVEEYKYYRLYDHPEVLELLKKVFPLCEGFLISKHTSYRTIIHSQGKPIKNDEWFGTPR